MLICILFFFSSRRRHTRSYGDWSSDVCSSDLEGVGTPSLARARAGAVPLPHGAMTRYGTLQFRMDSCVRAINFSSKGKALAARSDSGGFSLWECDSGKEYRHHVGVTGYSLSGDGKTL